MRPMAVRIRQSRNGRWYFVPVAANGEPGGRSQMYTRKWSAKRAARRWHPGAVVVEESR